MLISTPVSLGELIDKIAILQIKKKNINDENKLVFINEELQILEKTLIKSVNDKKIEALKSFGTNFGMAFQLIDDAIDYSSTNEKLGKNIGDDFKEGKVTLPIILAYLRSNGKEKKFWNKTIVNLDQSKNELSKAIQIIKKYNCINDTVDRARHFTNVAIDSLGIFENNKYKKSLMNLITSSLNRFH